MLHVHPHLGEKLPLPRLCTQEPSLIPRLLCPHAEILHEPGSRDHFRLLGLVGQNCGCLAGFCGKTLQVFKPQQNSGWKPNNWQDWSFASNSSRSWQNTGSSIDSRSLQCGRLQPLLHHSCEQASTLDSCLTRLIPTRIWKTWQEILKTRTCAKISEQQSVINFWTSECEGFQASCQNQTWGRGWNMLAISVS